MLDDRYTMDEEVREAGDFLDYVRPRWAESIDPESLDLTDCHDCVLGQAFQGYTAAMRNAIITPTLMFGRVFAYRRFLPHWLTYISYRKDFIKGVDILDEELPNWWRHVKADSLVMWKPERCILGQIYGVASKAPLRLHRFKETSSYANFTGFWKQLIGARQAVAENGRLYFEGGIRVV